MADQTQTAVSKRRAELKELTFGTQGGELFRPSDGAQLLEMAQVMSKSGLMVRDFYRDNVGVCAALIMICAPYGFNPFLLSWKTYRASKGADAPISFEAQAVMAMVNQSAPVKGRLRFDYEGEGQNRRCTVTGTDRETGEDITYTSPALAQIPVQNSPLWKSDPDQQLAYYSARAWCRRHFPELLMGIYSREEIGGERDGGMRDVTPEGGGFAERVAAAQETPAEAPDAPEAEDATPADDGPPVDAYEAGFPGSAAWEAGSEAFRAGTAWTDAPDGLDSEAQADWISGWVAGRDGSDGA